jgi:hypothetical protein
MTGKPHMILSLSHLQCFPHGYSAVTCAPYSVTVVTMLGWYSCSESTIAWSHRLFPSALLANTQCCFLYLTFPSLHSVSVHHAHTSVTAFLAVALSLLLLHLPTALCTVMPYVQGCGLLFAQSSSLSSWHQFVSNKTAWNNSWKKNFFTHSGWHEQYYDLILPLRGSGFVYSPQNNWSTTNFTQHTVINVKPTEICGGNYIRYWYHILDVKGSTVWSLDSTQLAQQQSIKVH